jgi:ABC-type multidrug transport system ATPase subunit
VCVFKFMIEDMDSSLRIKNYKRIYGDITFDNLASVNYLVGKNGAGKSSVLNALAHLKDDLGQNPFFREDSIILFKNNGKQKGIELIERNPNKVMPFGDMISVIIIGSGDLNAPFTSSVDGELNNIDKGKLDFINITSELFDNPQITTAIKSNPDDWSQTAGKRIFKHEDIEITLQYLSDGIKSFNHLRYGLEYYKDIIINDGTLHSVIILIEEPENNLHPEFQKRIPEFLESYKAIGNLKTTCFVSTHSPFIISASKGYQDQKVYLMHEGYLLANDGALVNSSEGYSGIDCSKIVGQMLGAEVTDLGYPENYCILEESSLQVILDHAKSIGLLKNIQFVSSGGWSKAVNYSNMMEQIENLDTLVKCNPFYKDKYLMILDNTVKLNQDRINRIKVRLKERFHELKRSSLEEYYLDFNPEIYDTYTKETVGIKDQNTIGLIKDKCARKICDFIQNKSDLSKLFNKEIDFLFKD